MSRKKTLAVLSGPSCVGKKPLRDALRRYFSEIKYGELVLCNSRKPRFIEETQRYEAHGVDYYFLPRGLFAQLDRNRFAVATVRTDIQAIDIWQVMDLLEDYDLILAEVYYTLGQELIEWAKRQKEFTFDIRTIGLLPLTDEELLNKALEETKDPEKIIYELMKGKLERRKEDDEDKIEKRARTAFTEMINIKQCYSNVIVNHAGEDAREEWKDPLSSEAERVLDEFVAVLKQP